MTKLRNNYKANTEVTDLTHQKISGIQKNNRLFVKQKSKEKQICGCYNVNKISHNNACA